MSNHLPKDFSPRAESNASPVDRGSEVLRRYRESRARGLAADADLSTISVDRPNAVDNDYEAPSFFDAIADGSQIASMYSDKKKLERGRGAPRVPASQGPNKKLFDDNVESSEPSGGPSSSVRTALDLLEELNTVDPANKTIVNRLSSMIREILNARDSAHGGINISPIAKFGQTSKFDDSVLKTPIGPHRSGSGGPGIRSVLKVYMDNNLEQEEDSMQYYESVINNLVEQLETANAEQENLSQRVEQLTEERDSYASSCSSLGDRLRAATKEFDDKLGRLALEKEELRTHFQQLLETLKSESAIAVESARSLEDEVLDLTRRLRAEEAARAVAEEGREESIQRYSYLEESIRGDSANTNAENSKLQLRVVQLEQELTKSNKLIADSSHLNETQTESVAELMKHIQAAEAEVKYKDDVMRAMDARIESTESRNQQYADEMRVLLKRVDLLHLEKEALESGKENAEVQVIQLQRDLQELTARRSLTTTPTRPKKGSSATAEKDTLKLLVETQAQLQQCEDDLLSKSAELERLALLSQSYLQEIEELQESNKQYEAMVASMDQQTGTPSALTKQQQDFNTEYTMRLQIDLERASQQVDELTEELTTLTADYNRLKSAHEDSQKHATSDADTKKSNKKEIAELSRRLAESIANEDVERNRAVAALKDLDKEIARNRQLNKTVEETNERAKVSEKVALELRNNLLELQHQLYQQQQHASAMSPMNQSVGDVSPMRRGIATPNSTARMEDFLLNSGASSPESRHPGGQDAINMLKDQLVRAEDERDDLKTENTMLIDRLGEKTEDCFKLREELEVLQAEIDNFKTSSTMSESSTKQLLERQATMMDELQGTINNLDLQIDNLNQLVEEKEQELQDERKVNENLRNCLEAKCDEDTLSDARLAEAVESISSKQQEIMYLRQQLQEVNDASRLREQALELQLADREEETAVVKGNALSTQNEIQSSIADLKKRLDRVQKEKEDMQSALAGWKEKCNHLEIDNREKSGAISAAKKDLSRIVESLQFYRNRFDLQMDSLEKQTGMWFNSFNNRVDSISDTVNSKHNHVRAFRADFDGQLQESQLALLAALEKYDYLAEDYELMSNKLKDVEAEKEDLEKSLEEFRLESQLQQQDLSRDSINNANEEMVRLSERLEAAERRAVELSTSGAKAFARSSRTIAYLEGECARLGSLADHFKGVNAKLSGDLKLINNEALRVKGLEHRLKMAGESEVTLLNRIASLEGNIRSKEKELLLTLHSSQNQEEVRSEQFEAEVRDLTEKLRLASEKHASQAREFKLSVELYESRLATLTDELTASKEIVERFTIENSRLHKNIESEEVAILTLKSNLRDREDRIIELDSQIVVLTQEKITLGDAGDRRKAEIETLQHDKTKRIRELEANLVTVKKQLAETEASNMLKDDVISSALSKQSGLSDESRVMRSRIDTLVNDNNSLLQSNEELRSQLHHVSEKLTVAENLFVELKDNTHRETVSRLHSVEDSCRRIGLELEMLKETHSKTRSELTTALDQLAATDKKLHSSQSRLAHVEGEYQAAQTTIQDFGDENSSLRSQIEDLTMRMSSGSREQASLRSLLQERENEIELFASRLKDMEDALVSVSEKNSSYECFEADLVGEMKSFADTLVSGSASTVMTREGVEGVPYNADNDFFSSPIPTHNYHLVNVSSPPKDDLGKRRVFHSSNTFGVSTPIRQDLTIFPMLRQNFEDLKVKSEGILTQNAKLKEQLAAARKELLDGKRRIDYAEQELRACSLESEKLAAQLEGAEDDLAQSRREMAIATDERAALYSSADEFAQNVRVQLRHLETSLSDAVSKANAITAGRVICGPNEKPIILSYQPSSPSKHAALSVGGKGAVDFGVTGLLTASVKELDRTLGFLCSALEAIMADSTYKKNSADRTELDLVDKERVWGKERAGYLDRIAAADADLVDCNRAKKDAEGEAANLTKQLDAMKVLLVEFTRQKEELESECRASMSNTEALQSALGEAEAVCLDLRTKLRASQSENEIKLDEINSLATQLDVCRKRLGDSDLGLEKLTSNFARLKSEKDAVDGVRRSLESELDRTRAEYNSMKLQMRHTEDESRSSYEVEKLLAALSTSLDQVAVSMANTRPSQTAAGSATNPMLAKLRAPETSNDSSITMKVESAIRRLGDLRNWAREESRSRRSLEEKCDSQEQDLSSLTITADGLQDQLRRAMQSASDKSQEVRDKVKEITEMNAMLIRKQEETDKSRRDANTLQAAVDDEKKSRARISAELLTKDAELSRIRLENENLSTNVTRLTEQLALTTDRLSEVSAENDQRGEQIRIIKTNNSRLSASLNMLEQGLDRDRSDRGALEQRLHDVESAAGVNAKLRVQVHDLESALTESKETLRLVQELKDSCQRESQDLSAEVEGLRRKLSSTENRLEQSQRERIALQEDCHNHRHAAGKLSQQLEHEQSSRQRAESALEALKRSNQHRTTIGQDYVSIMGDVEDKIFLSEEERNSLRNQNHSLKLALEEKESLRHAEESKVIKLEREIQLLQSKLNMTSQEVDASNTRAAALRTEGRRARSQVLDAVAQIWEVVDIVRADAQVVGIELHTPTRVSTDNDASMLGLEEALGVPELVTALESMRAVVDFIRDMPRNRSELETSVRRLEQDKVRLQRDIANTEARCEDRLQRLREELQTLQSQLGEVRRSENLTAAGGKQVLALENVLKQERDDKEKALLLVSKLKEECDMLTKDLFLVKKDLASQRATFSQAPDSAEMASTRSELDTVRREANNLRKELQAVSHHRTVLRDTLEQVEKQLRSKVDALAEAQFVQENPAFSNNISEGSPSARVNRLLPPSPSKDTKLVGAEDELLRRQIARYRARSLAMEELVSTYRSGVMALYSDGASYGAAQFGWQHTGVDKDGLGVGWIEREMSNVRRSYEDEIRLLESEVNELRGKLRQSGSYISELSKRFEDNMKSLYSRGGSRTNDGLLLQYEHVSMALEKAEMEILDVTHELAIERQEGKRRHTNLVEDLVKALQARDAAMSAVKRLEVSCVEAGMQHVAIYEALKAEIDTIPGTKLHDTYTVQLSKAGKSQQSFDVETLNISDRRPASASAAIPTSASKKRTATTTAEKIERLKEREREREDKSIRTSGSGTGLKGFVSNVSSKPLLTNGPIATSSSIPTHTGKQTSPADNQPFVVRHASTPMPAAAPSPAVPLKSSPPLNQRLSNAGTTAGAGAVGTSSSRNASPSASYPLAASGSGSGSLRIARASSQSGSSSYGRHSSPSASQPIITGPTQAGYVNSAIAPVAPFWFHHIPTAAADNKPRAGSKSRGVN